jgi:mevalonate kinase
MDIAAVSLGVPIEFHREAGPRILQAHWTPKLTIHDSGIRASTAVCVQKVMALHDQDPEGARALDLRMQQAVNLIRQALEGPLSPESIESFRSGIEAGHEVFRAWGLVPEPAEKLREDLKSRGALAVRLTGAGDGGFLLAFWD